MNRRVAGFSLIEVLVVVVIAAIVTGFVVVRFASMPDPSSPRSQLERVAVLVQAQCEQAVFHSRPRGIRFTGEGIDFWQPSDGGWVRLDRRRADEPRRWQGQARFRLIVEGYRVSLDDPPDGPQVLCQPLGELTRFELVAETDADRWRLVATGRADMSIENL